MSKHDEVLLERDGGTHGDTSPQLPRRINVAVSADMLMAIDRVIEREHVTLTESVRRLITYGDFVYRTAKIDRAVLLVRLSRGDEMEVVLV
jgi:hypothetical protein